MMHCSLHRCWNPSQQMVKKSSGDVQEERPKPKPKLYNPVKKKKAVIEEKPNNFFGAVSENKEVTKAMAQLSSCMAGMRVELSHFNERWQKYKELWEVDRLVCTCLVN